MSGTGFMKCMPRNLPGRSVCAPSRVIEIEDVFDAISAPGAITSHSFLSIAFLTCSSSIAASIEKSQVLKPSYLVPVLIRFSAASASLADIFLRSTSLARLASTFFIARSSASLFMSIR